MPSDTSHPAASAFGLQRRARGSQNHCGGDQALLFLRAFLQRPLVLGLDRASAWRSGGPVHCRLETAPTQREVELRDSRPTAGRRKPRTQRPEVMTEGQGPAALKTPGPQGAEQCCVRAKDRLEGGGVVKTRVLGIHNEGPEGQIQSAACFCK